MEPGEQLRALHQAMRRLGVVVREEALPEEARLSGGLCTVHGERLLFVDPEAPPERQIEVLLSALKQLPHAQIWLPPRLRAKVELEPSE